MQLTTQRRQELSSATLTQTLGLMVAFSGVLVVASNATQPAWWLSRGAVRPAQVTTNSGVVTTNYIPNDYCVVTEGQLKQFTARAVEEMNAHLSGGAGTNLNSLVSNWTAEYATNGYTAAHPKPTDYTVMNVGQLKYIGNQVWTRLVAAGVTNAVPSWLATNALDHQLANLGQVKSVFNFEMAAPALTPPQAVTNLTATAGTDEVDLAWTNPSGDSATGIVIEVSADDGATWSTVTTLDPNADTYAASADPSQNLGYRVTRENSSGSSSSASTTPVTPNSGPPVPRFAVIDLGINIAAYGMNASGAVVGNRYDPANSPTEDDYYSEPIEWSQGQIYPLALPGGVAFQVDDMTWTAVAAAVGISDAGVIVGDPMVGDRLVDPIYWPNKDAGPIDLVSGASFAPFWGDGTNPYQMGIPAYVQSIASDGTVFGSDLASYDFHEEAVRFLPTFAVLWDPGPDSAASVYGASGHWAVDYGSDDGSGFEGANIDGVMHPGFWVFGLNDSGLAVGYSYYGPPYEAFLIGSANIDLGPGWALALNNATVTVNGHTIPQPQIVGIDFDSDYVPHGLLWDHLNLDGTPAAKYVAKKLDDLLPASSGWSQTYPAAINLGGAICGTANYSGTNSAIPAGEHGVLLIPLKIRFAKPVDATWSDMDEKQVMLYTDDVHIHITVPMVFTSLAQMIQIPELSKIHLKTNITLPAGVDVPLTVANCAFNPGTDPNTTDLRIVLTRQQIKDLGLLPQNDDDSIDEKTWYDWGSHDATNPHNLTDSEAFDLKSPAISLGQCSSYGHLSDQPPKKPNSPLDKTYLQVAGREVITASIGGLASDPRAIAHQADTFYISAEGHIATGLLDTDGTNSDSQTFGASDAQWSHSLKTAILAGCSVLNIKGYRSSEFTPRDSLSYEIITVMAGYITSPPSPGETWEGTGPKYLLGYAFHAPTDIEGSTGISTSYQTLVNGGMNPIQAWGQANNGTSGNNACAIDISVSPHQYWYLKRSSTSPTGLAWTSVNKTSMGWP